MEKREKKARRGQAASFLVRALALAALGGALGVVLVFPTPARADEPFTCELEQARGIDEDDALSATELLCAELHRASAGAGHYEITLASLGRLVLVSASRRETGETISVRTEGVEEIPTAAPRIAVALAEGRPLADTQRVGNLVSQETLPDLTKPGGVRFLAGVSHVRSPGYGATGASVSLGMMYASRRFSLPAEFRLGWADDGPDGASLRLFSAGIGARGYFTDRDVSPYVGGGLGLLTLDAYGSTWREGSFDGSKIGFGTYVELGVEALRLHRARVALSVRADIPTYSLRSESWDWQTPGVPSSVRTRYVWPISIGASVAF